MLLDCLPSCTRCMSARWQRRGADRGQRALTVPVPVPAPVPVQVAAEEAPGGHQGPAADDVHGAEPPFQTELCAFTNTGEFKRIQVTVDHSQPVNVVTEQCLKKLGLEPLQHALPSQLGTLAINALPGQCGWQKLTLYAPTGHRGLSFDIDFVVVGDNYHCDLLLGREFRGVTFRPQAGIYPNYTIPKSKEQRERDERQTQERQAQEAEAAVKRKRQSAEKLEQSRKQDPKSGDGAGEGTSA